MNDDLIKVRSTCRLCNSANLIKVLDLPPSQPVDGFRPHAHSYLNLPKFNMNLYMCENCGHHQLLDVVNPNILYGSYIYTSSSSPDLKKHFKGYADYLYEKGCIKKNTKVLDVGCNDGLFLNSLSNYSRNLFGIDPAPNINKNKVLSSYFLFSGYCNLSNLEKLKKENNIDNFQLITANNVFAHADNLHEMLESISIALSEDGYFCFEVSYVYDLVKSNVVDYIYHEHLSYHGIKSLRTFLRKYNLYINDIKRIPTKGGSIRVLASKNLSLENKNLINKFINLENSVNCYSNKAFLKIQNLLDAYKYELQIKLTEKGLNQFICYGAAPTSIVNSLLLNYEKNIICFVDDNKLRQNLLSPNSFVPVLSPNIIKQYESPIVFIGAWRFSGLIKEKILKLNKKTKLVIPSLKEGIKFENFE